MYTYLYIYMHYIIYWHVYLHVLTQMWPPVTKRSCVRNESKQKYNDSGVGVIKPISSVPLFSDFFSIVKKHFSY